MKRLLAIAFLCGCQTPTRFTTAGDEVAAEPGRTYRLTFDDATGAVPAGMTSVLGEWAREAESSAPSAPNVLRQKEDFLNADFPRVILNDLVFGDATVRVRCRLEGGSTDRACGLIFRAKDSENYFITRANALEGNVRFYKVVDGSRMQLASANASIPSDQWHTLEAEARGDEIAVRWNGAELIRTKDSTYAKGKVGLWTKADSITAFDDFEAAEVLR